MRIQDIDIRVKCDIDCRLKWIVGPEHSCSLCKYYKPFDIPKVMEQIWEKIADADKQGRKIEEIHIKDDKIVTIIDESIWDEIR
ncbi:hypothetical protein LCGC14_1472790 [marine sediment metagenome]|uniref:Uncharacterized protein n=1 Tax=marine sediment metagenome TaxID=412755 RepID=A0A0F9JXV7_9ZZZZ